MAKYLITYQLSNSQATGGQGITKVVECDALTSKVILDFVEGRGGVKKVHETQTIAIVYIHKLEG